MENPNEKSKLNFEPFEKDKQLFKSNHREFRNQSYENTKISNILPFLFIITIVTSVFVSIKLTEHLKTYYEPFNMTRLIFIALYTIGLSFSTIWLTIIASNLLYQMNNVMSELQNIKNQVNKKD